MNRATCNCGIDKYLGSIIDKIICDEIIDVKETNFNEKDVTCKTQNVYILLASLLITITFLIAVSIILLSDKILNKAFITISRHKKLKQIYIDNLN